MMFLMVCFVALDVRSQVSENTFLWAHLNPYPSVGYNDCWGYTAPDGREYALLGVRNGTSIIDITTTPIHQIAFIPSPMSTWKDIKTYRHYAYVVTESNGGLQIIDLSNLPASASLVGTWIGLSTAHNISIDTANALLYAEGEAQFPNRVISLANPLAPVQVASFGISSHDIYGVDRVAFVSEGGSGSIGIFDMTVPSVPSLIGRFQIPNSGYVHNAWLSEDGDYLMTTEETNGKSVKYWDISNPDSVWMTDEYFASPFLAHNTHIKGNYAYISYYAEGLRIVDLSDPSNIVQAGYYDTYQGSGGGFDGAWGAFPFFASGKILASDIQSGLYVVMFEPPDGADPRPPGQVRAYSDHSMATSMLLTWDDPNSLVGGTALTPGEFSIQIKRDGNIIANVPGGAEQFVDSGLVDGQEYVYLLSTRLVANDSISQTVSVSRMAGGARQPNPPTSFHVSGTGSQIVLVWKNPSRNIDGSPMGDFAGIRLYDNNILAATFARTAADTGRFDSVTYVPSVVGEYRWYLQAFDSEAPPHTSVSTATVLPPLYVPVQDRFSSQLVSYLWINYQANTDIRSVNPPSPPRALNLDSRAGGGDMVEMRPVNMIGFENSGIVFSYHYQPQGSGEAPEPEDSLLVYFKNSAGDWIEVAGYPGGPVQPFQQEIISIAAAPNGGATYFFNGFQVRFKSKGTPMVFVYQDDWFIDDVMLSLPASADESQTTPIGFVLYPNYPNPFNPMTTIEFEMPRESWIRISIFNTLGQEIQTLVNEVKTAGRHTVRWNGENNKGGGVASGTYFCRFESGGNSFTRKMLLLR
ncbi:MAG: choice-of-anchor B family protein [Bacteroidota bacterium]